MAEHTTLHVNCNPDDKRAWNLSAKMAEMTLEDWVSKHLNAAAINARPEWAVGLSDRATAVLLVAGFQNRDQVKKALAENHNFAALPNAGRRVAEEIKAWLT